MAINIDQHTDAFTHAVYQKIDADVRATLSPRQVHAIENAIRASKPFQRHPVDVRGVLPCFFARFYFVLLMGRDRRSPVRNKEQRRRQQASIASAMCSVYLLLCALLPLIFLGLYLIKAWLGIDIFPDAHLSDWFSARPRAHLPQSS